MKFGVPAVSGRPKLAAALPVGPLYDTLKLPPELAVAPKLPSPNALAACAAVRTVPSMLAAVDTNAVVMLPADVRRTPVAPSLMAVTPVTAV
jgi:hypothetical protein